MTCTQFDYEGELGIMEQELNQQKLMELVVDKVLKKHGVVNEKPELDDEEKQKIAEIVQNIKTDVEKFLENANKVKTENDFAQQDNHELSEPVVEQVPKRQTTFTSNNDVNAAKTFFNRRNR